MCLSHDIFSVTLLSCDLVRWLEFFSKSENGTVILVNLESEDFWRRIFKRFFMKTTITSWFFQGGKICHWLTDVVIQIYNQFWPYFEDTWFVIRPVQGFLGPVQNLSDKNILKGQTKPIWANIVIWSGSLILNDE